MQQALERATRRDIETAFPSRLLLFKFREDQPRDDAGRFSSDGGGGVAAPTRTMGDVLTGMNYPEVSPYQFFNDANERDRGGLGSAAFVTPQGTLHDIKRAEHEGVRNRMVREGVSKEESAKNVQILATQRETFVRFHDKPTRDQYDVIRDVHEAYPNRSFGYSLYDDKTDRAIAHGVTFERMQDHLDLHYGFQTKVFNPDQARDERGRFSSGGGAGVAEAEAPVSIERSNAAYERQQGDDLLGPGADKWYDSLDDDELGGIGGYAGNPMSFYINGSLRGTRSVLVEGQPTTGEAALTKEQAKTVAGLDSALSKASLDHAVVTRRALSDKTQFEPGTTFTDKGYVSTTVSPTYADRWTGGSAGASGHHTVDVVIPKGAQAAYIRYPQPILAGRSTPGREGEVLIARNSQFRVDSPTQITYLGTSSGGEKQRVATDNGDSDVPGISQADRRFVWEPGDLEGVGTKLEAKYSEDQPRDEGGRWTSGEGGGISPPAKQTSSQILENGFDTWEKLNSHEFTPEEYKARIAGELADRLRDNPSFKEFVETGGHNAMVKPVWSRQDDPTAAATSDLVQRWSGTSGDGDRQAVAMQLAVKDEFGLHDVTTEHFLSEDRAGTMEQAQKDYDKNGDAYRAFARAMYDNTQEELKAQDIQSMTLYRGMMWDKLDDFRQAGFGAENAKGAPVVAATQITQQPASSWSFDPSIAVSFSGSRYGTIMAANVPRERILSTMKTGIGSKDENEVVVLGGADKVNAWTGAGSFWDKKDGPDVAVMLAHPGGTAQSHFKVRAKPYNVDTDDRNADWIKKVPPGSQILDKPRSSTKTLPPRGADGRWHKSAAVADLNEEQDA